MKERKTLFKKENHADMEAFTKKVKAYAGRRLRVAPKNRHTGLPPSVFTRMPDFETSDKLDLICKHLGLPKQKVVLNLILRLIDEVEKGEK